MIGLHWSTYRYREHQDIMSSHNYKGVQVVWWKISSRLIKGLNLRWEKY